MNTLSLFSLCLLIGVVLAGTLQDDQQAFKEFMGQYNREYQSETEFNFRFQAFRENKAFIERHNNKRERTHDVAINKFADMTHEEYKEFIRSGGSASNQCFGSVSDFQERAIPSNLDWRSTGNVAPVENEGQCGSVSYFVVANQVASTLSIAVNKPPVPLSVQQMMDCYESGNDNGCNGGDPWDLYLYIMEKGLEPESIVKKKFFLIIINYPYNPANATKCKYDASKTVATITGSGNVTTEAAMKNAVATYGPTSALFDASAQEFEFYSSGIFYATDCSASSLDHVLLLVGYGVSSNNTDFWIAQNVWGQNWGMNGYVNILRNKDTCGIATCSTYVTGTKPIKHTL